MDFKTHGKFVGMGETSKKLVGFLENWVVGLKFPELGFWRLGCLVLGKTSKKLGKILKKLVGFLEAGLVVMVFFGTGFLEAWF